jgi:phosphinothricin acetyltransferase
VARPEAAGAHLVTGAGVRVRPASAHDLLSIVEILNETAAHSTASFDSQPTSVADRQSWFEQFSASGPYRALVAEDGGQVVGYACSQRYRDHEAFRMTVEVSISLDANCRGQGVGSQLYRDLFAQLEDAPVHVALAGIAVPNDASVALHRKFGFTEVGTFREYAVKDGRYLSSVWMQRVFGDG